MKIVLRCKVFSDTQSIKLSAVVTSNCRQVTHIITHIKEIYYERSTNQNHTT